MFYKMQLKNAFLFINANFIQFNQHLNSHETSFPNYIYCETSITIFTNHASDKLECSIDIVSTMVYPISVCLPRRPSVVRVRCQPRWCERRTRAEHHPASHAPRDGAPGNTHSGLRLQAAGMLQLCN